MARKCVVLTTNFDPGKAGYILICAIAYCCYEREKLICQVSNLGKQGARSGTLTTASHGASFTSLNSAVLVTG